MDPQKAAESLNIEFVTKVVQTLKDQKATVALAESCTGGLVGALITHVPGSSEVFEFGAVTYSNEIKYKILKVPREILNEHGAVSEQCVCSMAFGVRCIADSTYGVAISGIAGPGGGTERKPVGTVHLAISYRIDNEDKMLCGKFIFPGHRERIRDGAAYAALDLILSVAEKNAK
jgi:PncC family amidohydrolase